MNRLKRLTGLLLSLTILLVGVFAVPQLAKAQTMRGIVTTSNDPLNVREGPGTNYKGVGTVPKGATVDVLDISNSAWYKISYGSITGYASSTYIKIISVPDDSDFEAYLTAQGFPESYKPYLRELHAAYPEWKFVARRIKPSWSESLAGEMRQGLSLVSKSYAIGSELSYEKGAYDFDAGTHVVYDSGGWVMASNELVAYCLDPRNYLTSSYIFAFKTMAYSESETYSGVASIIKGTFLDAAYPSGKSDSSSFATYTDAILAAAKSSGVSAYHLASYIVQEQGRNGMELSFGTWPGYEGYYNFLNIGAYKTSTMQARERGAWYAKKKGWDTPYKSILGGGQFLASGYINVGQDNVYLKKFDLIERGGYFNHQYMGNIKAVFSEANEIYKAHRNIMNNDFVFEIPVFDGMPDSVCPKPTAKGSNNNVLRSLAVDGFELTPSFEKYTYDYDLIVEANVSQVNVSASAYDSTAAIAGVGSAALNEGANTVSVRVTAASGSVRTYTLNIFRQSGGTEPEPEPEIVIDGKYTIGEYITGVAAGTTLDEFKRNLGVSGGDIDCNTAGGGVRGADEAMGTGDIVSIRQNGVIKLSYTVVIYGDVNGDGKTSIVDVVALCRNILGTYELNACRLAAADVNRDSRVSIVDVVACCRSILGTYTINQ